MNKWIHIVKADGKLYVSGKLTTAISELDGHDIIDFKVKGIDCIWLKLRKK